MYQSDLYFDILNKMEQLSKKIYQKPTRPIKIMQFGEGNFLRAFVDDFLQILNEKQLINADVVVVQPMSSGRIRELDKQDGLYTLFLEGLKDGQVVKETKIIDVLADFVNPFDNFEKYLQLAHSTDLEIVFSNTTEAGIVYLAEDIMQGTTPKSFPGKLLIFLYERFKAFNGDKTRGLDIVPCELIDNNGDMLKDILIKLANFNQLPPKFIKWISEANRFYNTLVDRIVPGFPTQEAKELAIQLGYIDNSMVKGEIFHLWVIQGPKRLQEILPFSGSGLNCHYVKSIVPYKQQKVKILNGSHTALVPISYLLGNRTVRKSIEDPAVGLFVNRFIFGEVIPTIDLKKSEVTSFANSVIERYQNPFIHHLLMSIALNGISKFKSRIIPTILDADKKGIFPKHALFSFAALIRFYQGIDEKGEPILVNDDPEILQFFKSVWQDNKVCCIAKKVGEWSYWETDYFLKDDVSEFVAECLITITNEGIKIALEKLEKGEL